MRPVLITLTAGTLVLLLSGCPDILPGGVPVHENAANARADSASRSDAHRKVGEIAWFQGTIDEAFSRRGCADSHRRRTLFRF